MKQNSCLSAKNEFLKSGQLAPSSPIKQGQFKYAPNQNRAIIAGFVLLSHFPFFVAFKGKAKGRKKCAIDRCFQEGFNFWLKVQNVGNEKLEIAGDLRRLHKIDGCISECRKIKKNTAFSFKLVNFKIKITFLEVKK